MSIRDDGSRGIWLILLGLIILLISIPFLFPLFVPYMGVNHMQGMAFMMGWGVLYFLLFILIIVLVIIVTISYVLKIPSQRSETPIVRRNNGGNGMKELMRVLTPEEKVVLNLLIKNGGEMLQKDISRELGFTRLKTHRILERMKDRNLIRKVRIGNTNKVILVDWIRDYID